ncbi:MAG: Tyrosyl-tRNA synthetase [Candidatus Woesebacteria bacterium]|jgi:tyrosyl-tRNA synthetase|nr:MAG: Tyrosyl-tRNA synthetase [Candidatus Woesebacteria bacterium]
MEIKEVLERGVEEVLPSKEGLEKLMSERKITLYQGFDPTAKSLHLGHLAGTIKLKQFQRLGHKVIFLIGDFTGRIGDPTGKISARKQLSKKEIEENLKGWLKTISQIIDFKGENKAEIKYNSEWNEKITFSDLIEITSNFTVQQMIERDMFQERIKRENPIYLHEFLYPVAQAIDSVKLGVDLEIGGSDQLFNMMAGRQLVKALTGREKYVLTIKLLEDKEGKKVGKTEGNAIFLDEPPEKIFGGVMAFPDQMLMTAFELFTELELAKLEREIKNDPLNQKKRLAFEVVKIIYGEEKARQAQEKFEKDFQLKNPTYDLKIKLNENLLETIFPLLGSKSEAKRLISSGSVDVNGKTVKNYLAKIKAGDKIKIGKKIFATVN